MNVKHGFSTLNRLLGKKNKGHHLSKSTTNLSLSSSSSSQLNYDTNSSSALSSHHLNNNNNNHNNHQLEQNRITPLPIATTNAPFEQTFRITVLLPKGQLYVARLGAKTKLQKLLEIVCENKQLDQEKYEFRHPVDSSQVFSCELTIGAVGLNEIRLCHKSEAYDNFNADDIIKLRHTGRDSLSSSEFSSRNSKHTLKTASPYSSTNSLNSIDSTGMSTSYRGQIVSLPPIPNTMRTFIPNKQNGSHHGPVAPARKKRAAPRPPSQNSIPEKEPVNGCNGNNNTQEPRQSIPRKEFHVSSPNLMTQSSSDFTSSLKSADFHRSNVSIDCNGNTSNKENGIHGTSNSTKNNSLNTTSVTTPNGSLSNGHHSFRRNDSQSSTESSGLQKTNLKTRPVSMSAINDAVNQSITINGSLSGNETDSRSDRSESNGMVNGSTETLKVPEPTPRKRIVIAKKKAPAPPPRTLPTPVALPRNSAVTNPEETIKIEENVKEVEKPKLNGSVPREISKPIGYVNGKDENKTSKEQEKLHTNNITTTDSQTTKEILPSVPPVLENQIPSSIPQSPASDISQCSGKPASENSSDEEEHIKVYNLKLGKTICKPLVEHKTYEDLSTLSSLSNENEPIENEEINQTEIDSESPSWICPIPAPPNFADDNTFAFSNRTTINDDNKKLNLSKQNSTSSTNSSSDISDSSLLAEKISKDIKGRNSVISRISSSSNTTDAPGPIITSDIEDGYRGGTDKNEENCSDRKLVKNIEIKTAYDVKDNKLEVLNRQESHDSRNSLSAFEVVENNRNDVITELNNVINENKMNTVISRSEDTEEIESPKRCTLDNFKIQSYSSNSPKVADDLSSNGEEVRNSPRNEEVESTGETQNSVKSSIQNHSHQEEIQNGLNQQKEDIVTENMKTPKENKEPISSQQHEEKISIQFENNQEKLNESLNEQQKSSKPSSEEDRLYKKRSSVSSNGSGGFKSRVSITRSDSFHSTRNPNTLDSNENYGDNDGYGLSLRSSSYVSLLNAQNLEQNRTNINRPFTDTHRRKSSSELSIGESPSLQSLVVMKTILNSHKNSITTENDLQRNESMFNSKPYTNGYAENSIRNDTKISRTSYDENDSSKENSPKNKILSQGNTRNDVINTKEQQPEKRWKYQGPPSINLTSWSERPKIQVSIKNDGDYKFGIGGGGIGGTSTSITTFPRVYRSSTTMVNSTQQPTEASNVQSNSVRIIGEQPKVPFVRSVEYKRFSSVTPQMETSVTNGETNSIVYIKPSNSDAAANVTTSGPTSMTLGRMPKTINRTASFAPTVRGFRNTITPATENGYHSLKTDSTTSSTSSSETIIKSSDMVNGMDSKSSSSSQKITIQTWKPSGNSLGRSNSVITTSSTKYSRDNNERKDSYLNGHHNGHNGTNGTDTRDTVEENPFSKIVLRKTGLKEKIMSSNTDSSPSKPTTPTKPASIQKINEQNCTKMELKLSTQIPNQKPAINPKPTTTPTSAVPPPPPPIIRSVVTKQKIGSGTNLVNNCVPDPRCQLLSAIRNFNKDSLKRS